MIYFCSNKNRRALVLQSTLNGIDYLEVVRTDPDCGKQLSLTFLNDARSISLTPSQVQITGGASSAAQVTVLSVSPGTNAASRVVTVELDKSGDFSTYTLSIVAGAGITDPPSWLDPQLSTVCFSFKAGCPTVADCAPDNCCPPDTGPEPDINYLAKDFGGFRQVMLDRMAVLAPTWSETHASDIGIAMVEVLAYAADHLSYQQDAVGTEAYIGKARSRISLRRHARLVDYKLNEGSNARTWLYVYVSQDAVFIPGGTNVYPYVSGFPPAVQLGTQQGFTQAAALANSPLGFSTMQPALLCKEQNEIQFYTWQDSNCCLVPGATTGTLVGHLTTLCPGMVLIFEEVVGPNTGDPEDANPNNRWAVRLTEVRNRDYQGKELVDPLTNPLVDPAANPPLTLQPITQISWAAEDALPFPLCISSITDSTHGSRELTGVSVARGNIIPADHGVWQQQPLLGWVALTNGSPTVNGVETAFTSTLQVGQWLVFDVDATQTPYEIINIENDTTLILAQGYQGATISFAIAAAIEDLGEVPCPPPAPVTEMSCTCNSESTPAAPLPRYYPELANSPVTFAWPFDAAAPASQFMTSASANTPAAAGAKQAIAGAVTVTNDSAGVTGTGTSFASALQVGQWLVFASDPTQRPYQIQSIASDTSLTLATEFSACVSVSGQVTTAAIITIPTSNPTAATHARPQLQVQDDESESWLVLDDLLSSNGSQRACVLEIEHDGSAFLRFGDDQYGMAPAQGMDFQAHYRVGNGSMGNVGRDSLAHMVVNPKITTNAQAIVQVRNPLAAAGGVDPETMEHIQQVAPFAFRTQLRAVTEDDYGTMAETNPAIEEARGTLRWTGSWYTAFVSLDTVAESGPDAALIAETKSSLNLLRMMGVDLAVEGAVIVGLDIELNICVDPDYFQADVETALMQLFLTGNQCSGQPGLLNPENFRFGQTIYTSPFIAAAQAVQGVVAVSMAVFERMDDPSIAGATQGYLTLNRLEIARCDNDPNRLDWGKFVLHMDGGR
jgi:predicted phage baseplate assembly protein